MRSLSRAAPYVLVVTSLLASGVALDAARLDRVNSLSLILGAAAIVAGLMTAGTRGRLGVSAAFIVALLAAAFLGPLSAGVAAILSELAATARRRTQARSVVLINLPASVAPAVAGALVVRLVQSHPSDTVIFYLVMAAAGVMMLVLSYVIYSVLMPLLFGRQLPVRHFLEMLPSAGLNVALAVAGDRETRHRCNCANAGVAGRRANPGARRIGGRCCHSGQRSP